MISPLTRPAMCALPRYAELCGAVQSYMARGFLPTDTLARAAVWANGQRDAASRRAAQAGMARTIKAATQRLRGDELLSVKAFTYHPVTQKRLDATLTFTAAVTENEIKQQLADSFAKGIDTQIRTVVAAVKNEELKVAYGQFLDLRRPSAYYVRLVRRYLNGDCLVAHATILGIEIDRNIVPLNVVHLLRSVRPVLFFARELLVFSHGEVPPDVFLMGHV